MHVNFPGMNQDLRVFHKKTRAQVLEIIRNESEALGPIKYRVTTVLNLRKVTNQGEERTDFFTRQPNPTLLNAFHEQAVIESLDIVLERQIEELSNWVEKGSGWVVEGTSRAYFDVSRYDPLRGGHYLPLPKDLQSKNAIVNVKNKDNQCVLWALRAAMFPVSTA